jgi:TRAP-type C4-dicarboxylate transport system permease small subunit
LAEPVTQTGSAFIYIVNFIRRPLQFLSDISAGLTIGLTVAGAIVLVVALVLQVFFRYVVGAALAWSEELALLVFTWTVLLAGSLGIREGFLARLTLVADVLPRLPRAVLEKLTAIAIAVFGAFLFYAGYMLQSVTFGQVSSAIRYPIWLLYAAAPVTGALITIHALAALVRPISRQETESSLPGGEHE